MFPELVERLAPSILGLTYGPDGTGSAVVVGPGVAVTLARNVAHDEIELVTVAGVVDGRVVGADPTVDLAVIRFDADLPALEWARADASPPRIGITVHAFADPGGRGLRATTGTLAASPRAIRGPTGRLVEGALEHTAPLPPGSGGGPLVGEDGRILGLNAVRLPGGLILAWPGAALAARTDALAAGRDTAPAQLGISLAPPRETRRLRAAVGLPPVDGLLVRGVADGSPAAAAGLDRGDVLLSAGDTALDRIDALYAAVDAAAGDGSVALTIRVLHGAEERDIAITLAAHP